MRKSLSFAILSFRNSANRDVINQKLFVYFCFISCEMDHGEVASDPPGAYAYHNDLFC